MYWKIGHTFFLSPSDAPENSIYRNLKLLEELREERRTAFCFIIYFTIYGENYFELTSSGLDLKIFVFSSKTKY